MLIYYHVGDLHAGRVVDDVIDDTEFSNSCNEYIYRLQFVRERSIDIDVMTKLIDAIKRKCKNRNTAGKL